MNIQWFPGHMSKSIKLIKENLKLVDIVIELRDARIPVSSRNPEVDSFIGNKKRLIALNKSSLADNSISKEWTNWYGRNGYANIFIDSIDSKGIDRLKLKLTEMMKERIELDKVKGRIFRPIRTMIVGIPNVGKSTFINNIAGKKGAKTGDRPGVTIGKQWIRINKEIELLDTPGILWPKFQDEITAQNLAFTGAIKDEIMDIVELAQMLLIKLSKTYPKNIINRYKLSLDPEKNGEDLLIETGRKRGCIISGGEIDLYRTANIVLDEFRSGKLGNITLERPTDGDIIDIGDIL